MKKVGIITYHAAHNFGANLQAYALQKLVEEIGEGQVKCEIIDFRTESQRKGSSLFVKPRHITSIMKDVFVVMNYRNMKARHDGFENFISNYLHLSEESYSDVLELAKSDYDYYISGSDQIWNWTMKDFDMAYFLPFVKNGKRIAYAPSLGKVDYNNLSVEKKKEFAFYINNYDELSAREQNVQQFIYKLTNRESCILPDPTLTLEKKEWDAITPERIIKKDYIFFYNFYLNKEKMEIVKKIQQKTGLPVIVPRMSTAYLHHGIKAITNASTLEFLSLMKYAKFVITSSFHGTVFSIMFNKPFFVVYGAEDGTRVSHLLEMFRLTDRVVNLCTIDDKIDSLYDIKYKGMEDIMWSQREKAIKYLKIALEL